LCKACTPVDPVARGWAEVRGEVCLLAIACHRWCASYCFDITLSCANRWHERFIASAFARVMCLPASAAVCSNCRSWHACVPSTHVYRLARGRNCCHCAHHQPQCVRHVRHVAWCHCWHCTSMPLWALYHTCHCGHCTIHVLYSPTLQAVESTPPALYARVIVKQGTLARDPVVLCFPFRCACLAYGC
jgi:hypothetical protein